MRLDEIKEQWSIEKFPHVHRNIDGELSETESPGFYAGGKGPAKSEMVECVPRADDAVSLRKTGVKKAAGTSYKAAALRGFTVSRGPPAHQPALHLSPWLLNHSSSAPSRS